MGLAADGACDSGGVVGLLMIVFRNLFLLSVERPARDYGSKLFEHFRPAELSTPKCLFAPCQHGLDCLLRRLAQPALIIKLA